MYKSALGGTRAARFPVDQLVDQRRCASRAVNKGTHSVVFITESEDGKPTVGASKDQQRIRDLFATLSDIREVTR
jgi:hypothetical protein